MKYLILLMLIGCGQIELPKDIEPLSQENERLAKNIEFYLSANIAKNIDDVFKETKVYTTEHVGDWCVGHKDAVGCYGNKIILIFRDYEGTFDFCTTLAHEYIHAISDKEFGDPDNDHKKYDYELLSQLVCMLPHVY